jgi:hypothetical protein
MRAVGEVISATSEALGDAITEVHHVRHKSGMPRDAELLRGYDLLVVSIDIEDRGALAGAQELLAVLGG